MALEMREECERCGASISPGSEAYICFHEHTYCARCTWLLEVRCAACNGELVRRPRQVVRGGGEAGPRRESDE